MMTTYTHATDGCRLAYDCSGTGPGLLLVHGMGGSHRQWHDHGYVDQLASCFSVATLDLRGHGDSGTPHDERAYALPQMVSDLQVIAYQCHWSRFAILGFSLGGQLAVHAALQLQSVSHLVTVGTAFGPWLSAELITQTVAQMEQIARVKREDHLPTLHLSPANQQMVEQSDLMAHLACFRAATQWPTLHIQPLPCPTLMLYGTADTGVREQFQHDEQTLQEVGIYVHTLAELSHQQSVADRTVILPTVVPFLQDR